jgi:hypothetical protein
MATKASVFKSALRLLGEPSNVGPDSDKKIVRELNGAWEDVVRLCFEEHPWNQFKTLAQLTSVTPAELGWDYTFNVPATFRRVVLVSNYTNEDDLEGIPYAYRAGKILTNSETTFLWYVDSTYETQEGGWPQAFADWVGARLADEVYPINDEGDSTRSRINQALMDRFDKAKSLDSSTDPIVQMPPGRWVRSRRARLDGRLGSGKY